MFINADIPVKAPVDHIMAAPHEVQQMADWVSAAFTGALESSPWLDQENSILMFEGADPPFSFVYGGRPSSELLPNWKRVVTVNRLEDRLQHHVRWTDLDTGLTVAAVVSVFKDYPAVDWVIYFENRGTEDTPIIEDIQALDVRLKTENPRKPSFLHRLVGDTCSTTSFLVCDDNLNPTRCIKLSGEGGRSSSEDYFPFFNVQDADKGIITAVGWTGQWAASIEREYEGPIHMQAGMELTHLLLHPGERIRTPRILLMAWKGDRTDAHNRFRRLILFNYVPKRNGKPLQLPIALQCFDRYYTRPDWPTEAGQLDAVRRAQEIGCDTLWFDAAWFDRGFPYGVGTWTADPERFPRGLKPVSDACHAAGMQFLLWFEPERVGKDSQIAREHPEFVFNGAEGGLYKMNEPEARRYITDTLSKAITDYGIDFYRQDFNIPAIDVWRANDTPDRRGMTEIRYVEGLYEMLDELFTRHPGLAMDNCAGGGRRIDLEMCMRSVPLWRSDTNCAWGRIDWDQSQTIGLGRYIPLFSGAAWSPDTYEVRSALTAGLACQFDYLSEDYSVEKAKTSVAEVRELQKYWYGDFYPLTPGTTAPEHFAAYQFHRSDLNEGVIFAFRRAECDVPGIIAALRGIQTDKEYSLEFVDDQRNRTSKVMRGSELASGFDLRLEEKGTSLLVLYKALD